MKSNANMKIDEKKLNRLKFRILLAERENLRTKAKTNNEMIDEIRKMIEEEVKKCY